jgi:ketosteroid isomerase-like protein
MASQQAELLDSFNEAFNRHNVEAMMAMMTEDCLFENTFPAPDGTRFEGQSAVGQFWWKFFQSSPQAVIEIEEILIAEDRATQRWIYR